MYSPDQTQNFQSTSNEKSASEKVPSYGVREYLERAASFYFKQDKPKEEAGYLTLLQEISAHANKGENWKDDEYLVKEIETFIKERFENFIVEKQAVGDEEGVQYYQERLKVLLEDLSDKE